MSESTPSVDGLMARVQSGELSGSQAASLAGCCPYCHDWQGCAENERCAAAGNPLRSAERLAASPAGLKLQEPVARTVEDCPELNLSNYDAEDVALLNDWAVRADEEIDRLTRQPLGSSLHPVMQEALAPFLRPSPLSPGDSKSELQKSETAHAVVAVGSDLQAATAKIMRESAALLIDAHKHTTQGVWRKGMSTHHTVCDLPNSRDYRIAEFHHADDANFCDHAHRLVPMLCQWVLAADRAACEASAEARPSDEKAPVAGIPVSAVAEALQVLREYHQAFAGVFLAEMSLPSARLAAVARLRAVDEKAGALVAELDRARFLVGAPENKHG